MSGAFDSWPELCPKCGTVLPLPVVGNLMVERLCKKCGHNQARYHTQQTRSADEGQTVFYACASCGFQEKEDS
uniref:DNA-directed RNA polymerase I subunit RPA12 n=1 Tax=Eptatretus burgeri TaxID=7764 RepID=A0A8C4NFN2_EPTBU